MEAQLGQDPGPLLPYHSGSPLKQPSAPHVQCVEQSWEQGPKPEALIYKTLSRGKEIKSIVE